jgi:septal ring factor EnvC (AmiA/AmiB activator)
MATDQRTARIQPRLVKVEDGTGQPDRIGPPSSVARLIQAVQTEMSSLASSTAESAEPGASIQVSGDDETAVQSRNYLQTLEMISSAARTITSLEDESQRIKANAFALTQRVRSERLETDQQIGILQEQLKASQLLAEQLRQQLAEAEERANVAEEWLQHFQKAIASAFAARRAAEAAA